MAILIIYIGLILGLILNTVFGLIPLLSGNVNSAEKTVLLLFVLSVYSTFGTCLAFLMISRKRKK